MSASAREKSVRKVPGVGPSLHKRLKGTGVTTVGELLDRLPSKPIEAWAKKWKVEEAKLEKIAASARAIVEGADPKTLTARIEAEKAEKIRLRKEVEERQKLEEQREAEKKAMMDAAERKVREEFERQKEIEEKRRKREEKNKRAKEKKKGDSDSAAFGEQAVAIPASAVEEAKAAKEAEAKAAQEAEEEQKTRQREAEEERKRLEAEQKAREEAELQAKIEQARKEAAERQAREEEKRRKRDEKKAKQEQDRARKRKEQAAKSAKLKASAEKKADEAKPAQEAKPASEPAPAPAPTAAPAQGGPTPQTFRRVVAVAAAILIFFLFYQKQGDFEEASAKARLLQLQVDRLTEDAAHQPAAGPVVAVSSEHVKVLAVAVDHDGDVGPCRISLNQEASPVQWLELPASGMGVAHLEPSPFALRSQLSKVGWIFLETLDGSPLPRPRSIVLWLDEVRVELPIEEGAVDEQGHKWVWTGTMMQDVR